MRGQIPGSGFAAFAERKAEGGATQARSAATEEKKDSAIIPTKESLAKRKMAKEKDKERDNKKKLFKEKAERSEKNLFLRRKKSAGGEVTVESVSVTPKYIEITESISVGDLAKKLNIKASEVISKLMKIGMLATINQVLDSDTTEILASEYGTEVKVVSLFEETVIRQEEEDKPEDRIETADCYRNGTCRSRENETS